jgi:hypothetical protein
MQSNIAGKEVDIKMVKNSREALKEQAVVV